MYTINEVAKEFKVSHWTVRKWISSGKITAGKGLGGIGVSDEEVERLREEKTGGRDVAANCILSPRPKNHPRRKKGRIPLWER